VLQGSARLYRVAWDDAGWRGAMQGGAGRCRVVRDDAVSHGSMSTEECTQRVRYHCHA